MAKGSKNEASNRRGVAACRAVCGAAAALVAVIIGAWSTNVSGAQKRVTVPDIPVQVTFRNAPSPLDRLMSDGISPSYTNGYAGVQAILPSSTGSLQLFTCFASKRAKGCVSQGRSEFFDLRDPASQLVTPPAETVLQGAQMQVWVFGADGVTQLANGFRDAMAYPGAQYKAGAKINFDIGSTMHTVRFTPNMYPNSNYLLVTYLGGSLSCSASTPSTCATWTVEADSAAPAYGDIAEFVTGDNSTDYGQFHMPFKITVSVLPK